MLETGLFIFLLAFSFGFMFWAFWRNASIFSSILRIVSIAMFMGMALYIGSGAEVGTTTQHSETQTGPAGITVVNSTSTTILLAEGSASWMSYVFFGFAILNMILLVKEVFVR
jgi:hypothetical protein